MDPRSAPPALVAEAMRKAAVCWLSVGGAPAYPVWCAWAGGGLQVVSGPGEQPAPGLADASLADGGLADGGLAGAGPSEPGLADGGLADGGLAGAGKADEGPSEPGLAGAGKAGAGTADEGLSEPGPAGAGKAGAGLADAATVDVTARGDHGGAIVTWRASVERLRPDTPEWDALVPGLAARRLNSVPTGELVRRWAQSNVVVRLTPQTAE